MRKEETQNLNGRGSQVKNRTKGSSDSSAVDWSYGGHWLISQMAVLSRVVIILALP